MDDRRRQDRVHLPLLGGGLVASLLAGAVTLGGVGSASGAASSSAQSVGAERVETCSFVAHRGGRWPGTTENGLPGIRRSHEAGATRIEIDVRASRSGRLFAMHDWTVDRTTDGVGAISRLSTPQVRRLRLDTGEKVPYVKRIIRYASRHSLELVLHTRRIPSGSWIALRRQLREHDMRRRTTVMGSERILATSRDVLPRVTRVLIGTDPPDPRDVTGHQGAAVNFERVTQESRDTLGAAGKTYWAYPPWSQTEWERLRDLDAVLVKDVAGFLAWCRQN